MGFDGLSGSDASNYQLRDVTMRIAYSSAISTYIDTSFDDWTVASGRPQGGATARVLAGSATAAIFVRNSSATIVVYDVVLTVCDDPRNYTATADDLTSSGAPTYTVAPLG